MPRESPAPSLRPPATSTPQRSPCCWRPTRTSARSARLGTPEASTTRRRRSSPRSRRWPRRMRPLRSPSSSWTRRCGRAPLRCSRPRAAPFARRRRGVGRAAGGWWPSTPGTGRRWRTWASASSPRTRPCASCAPTRGSRPSCSRRTPCGRVSRAGPSRRRRTPRRGAWWTSSGALAQGERHADLGCRPGSRTPRRTRQVSSSTANRARTCAPAF
mmetsp:Transcript_103040/g.287034  ORF Transcript_103040/g.287034 Transcript_103040/m.287034 type:complete len:215 (+) Transcript_103040:199-843(+)